ncbi:MAG TPA: carboxylesterase family protein [Acidobacteriaceae bacterium]|nr:carboxylesterase family protein [Acidobacteriaceae bacterium]
MQAFRRVLPACLFLIPLVCAAQRAPYPPSPQVRVTIAQGALEGTEPVPGIFAYLGIPFAQPPVGDLRWKPPQPPQPWQGTRIADSHGSPCPQLDEGWNHRDSQHWSEDCLHLDVWTPAGAHDLPVMVYIHGGSNLAGDGFSYGVPLVSHGVVLVTIEYRLDIFGWFRTPQLDAESAHHASGDYGLLDQIAALRWVHDNITKFGGDPGKVMIFGQSAGAVDTGLLLASPLARGLFRAALEESGQVLGLMPTSTKAESEIAWAPVAKALGPTLAAQRSLRAAKVMAIDAQAPEPASVNWWGYRGASVDGWVLPKMPWRVYAEGREAPVALVLGTNAQEIAPGGETLDQLRHDMAETVGYKAAVQLETLYDNTPSPLLGPPATRFATGHDFHCAVRLLAEWHASHGFPTWVYRFDRPDPGQPSAIHTSELFYLFDSFEGSAKPTAQDLQIGHDLDDYWTSFAKNAVPTGPAPWPQYQAKQFSPWLDIPKTGTDIKAEDTPFGGEACAIMDPAYPK